MRSTAKILDSIPPATKQELTDGAFDRQQFQEWASRVGRRGADGNRVTGDVELPRHDDIAPAPAAATAEGAAALERGRQAIARGEVAFVVLAGGMATRMGGVVKALVEVLPGLTFLGYRVREIDQLAKRFGGRVPLWLMTSFATAPAVDAALVPLCDEHSARELATFRQNVSLRLTPTGDIFRRTDQTPSLYATGHGDLPDALRRSGLLDKFLAQGGKTVWIANVDNLGATVEPGLLGWHLGHGAPLSVELVDKVGTDKGGIPVRWDGRPVVLEEFRLPRGFDAAKVRTFNTNTFIVDARALRDAKPDWTFFEVHKKVSDSPTGEGGALRDAVQFERLLGELTSSLDTRFVKVPRDGLGTRFLPVKDGPELEARRGEIASIACDRGVVAQ